VTPLWDAASGRFQPVRLRGAIVGRAWTVREFAMASGVSPACLYNALRGLAVSDRTVVRIVTTLAGRATVALVDG
jgi:predicted transcriptional regulator